MIPFFVFEQYDRDCRKQLELSMCSEELGVDALDVKIRKDCCTASCYEGNDKDETKRGHTKR